MNGDAIDWHGMIARDFDAKYAVSRHFTERLLVWEDMIRRYCRTDSDVLDAGCGSGILSEAAARRAKSVVAFDGSAEMVALAEIRRLQAGLDNMSVCVGSLGDSSLLADRRFDVILCSSVLEYVDDYWHALDWLTAALKPGGVLIVSMPNAASLYRMAERAIYRLTGHPVYYRYVRHVPHVEDVSKGLLTRSLRPLEVRYYASTPLLSSLTGIVGQPQLSNNLFAIACGRA